MAETITQITQPPKFIEAESKLYLDQLRKAIGGLKGADLSKIMGPQFVAGMDPLTQQAIGMASVVLVLMHLTYKQLELLFWSYMHTKHLCLHINKM
jgi:hypothetical protein